MRNRTAAQQRFIEIVGNMNCIVTGTTQIQVHHIWGRSAKIKGVGNIGHWAILPLSIDLHDVNKDHPLNVTHHKKSFEQKFGKQGAIYGLMIEKLRRDPSISANDLPSMDVVDAIINYVR